MKTLNLALIFCLFIFGTFGASISWNGTSVGDWSVASNWAPSQVPSSGDTVTLGAGTVVSVSQNVNIDQLTTAPNSKITVINNSAFNINNNVTQNGQFTIQTEAGSSFVSVNYFIFDGNALNCFNFGSISLAPLVNTAIAPGVLSNSATGKNVVFVGGNKPNVINADFNVPSGFIFSNDTAHTFTTTNTGGTVIFASSTLVSSGGWSFANDGDVVAPVKVQFNSGATIYGNIVPANTDNARPRPQFTFTGSFTLTANLNLNVVPTFGAGVVAFNGPFTATFNLLADLNINSDIIQGNTILQFQNQLSNSAPITVIFGNSVSIDSQGFNFTGNWVFSQNTVTFTTPRNLNFNLTLNNNNLVYAKPSTFAANALLSSIGTTSVKFTDGFSSANQYTFNGFNPILDCTVANNKQFSVSGSALNFIAGLTVNGCSVSSSATLTITGSLTTVNGNTTVPSNTVINGTAFTFSGPTTSSIVLSNTLTLPINTAYTATGVEVILPSSGVLTLQENATLSAGTGLFSLNGGIALTTGNTIDATTAFPSGNSSISTNAKVTWSGKIVLRNTVLGGSGDVWFTGSILAVKGVSTITNPNFRFKGGVSLGYLYDQILPNTGCQLVINTSGNTGTRTIEGAVSAAQSSNIVFDDNININVTATVSGSGSPLGSVTFRTSGQTTAFLSTNATVTLNRNIFFNHTNFHLTGLGSFTLGTNPSIYLSGGLNFPNAANDAIVTANSPLYVGVVVNSTIGSTVFINSDLTTDDLDNIDSTASTKLTLFSDSTLSRRINGAYTLGSSLTFGGNVVLASNNNINSVGTIEILGTSLLLQSSATWNNKIVISQPFTITSEGGANTLTIAEQNPAHGFNIPAAFTVNNPATVVFNGLYSLSFQTASTLSGNGIVTLQNTIVTGTGAVTISPQTLTLSNVTLVGSGSYNIAPVDQNLNIATFVRAFVSTVYNGNTLTLLSDTTISPLFTFTANPLTINSFILTLSSGSYTINGRWIVNNNIVFQGATTIATTGSFSGVGGLTFNNSLILTQSTSISNPVTFGSNKDYIVSVSNGGFTLTLNSTSVTVNSIVVSAGGSIVSTSPNPPSVYQVISGSNGVINSDWTWSNSVQFGSLNVTGARTLNFNLGLTNGQTTYFTDGVTFNGGTFIQTSTSGTAPILDVEKSITTNTPTTIAPQINVAITGTSFNFLGTSILTINGTFTSLSAITFNQNVVFGYNIIPANSLPITLGVGSSTWSPSTASIQIWRSTITVNSGVNLNIQPSLIFGASAISINVGGSSNVVLNGNLNVFGTSLTGSGNLFLGPITITSQQNNTLSGFSLLGAVTLNSTSSPWVEPVFTPTGGITQSITLNGPARLASPTFGTQAQINGPARVAITDSITVSSAFTFNSPVQLYVSQAQGSFTFNLNGAQSYLTFTSTPSLFNPLGFNINTNTNFILTSSNTFNILKFALNSPLTIGDLTITSGTLQLTSSSTNARFVNVAGAATLWIDGNAFTSSAVVFSQNVDGTNPSYYQLTVSSNNPPAITTGSVVYKGAASIVVNNFNWDGTAVTGITATSSNGASNNFVSVTGSPGFTYTATRNSNNVQFSRTSNPSVSPSPTQSNGPSPAVSASISISMNMILFFAIFVIYFIF
eukprot:TRINITY_DN566_c0_g1_i1.p1 TRINITY_DN566_c0_g1~~TRINITY_DN566_c0_g1_i1.p1  ORF type:complete len:1628 (+),score=421.12 TRINITY_DN566_c0_g1_i1:48-4931(+)